MSATSAERRESRGFVGETLRKPIQEAVREGVKQAIEEERVTVRTRTRSEARSEEGEGSNWGRYALLALFGLGVAFYLMRQRRGGGTSDRRDSEIRRQSKTSTSRSRPGATTGSPESAQGGVETSEERPGEEGATPGAGSE